MQNIRFGDPETYLTLYVTKHESSAELLLDIFVKHFENHIELSRVI